jgi:hypothetical protein
MAGMALIVLQAGTALLRLGFAAGNTPIRAIRRLPCDSKLGNHSTARAQRQAWTPCMAAKPQCGHAESLGPDTGQAKIEVLFQRGSLLLKRYHLRFWRCRIRCQRDPSANPACDRANAKTRQSFFVLFQKE